MSFRYTRVFPFWNIWSLTRRVLWPTVRIHTRTHRRLSGWDIARRRLTMWVGSVYCFVVFYSWNLRLLSRSFICVEILTGFDWKFSTRYREFRVDSSFPFFSFSCFWKIPWDDYTESGFCFKFDKFARNTWNSVVQSSRDFNNFTSVHLILYLQRLPFVSGTNAP